MMAKKTQIPCMAKTEDANAQKSARERDLNIETRRHRDEKERHFNFWLLT